MKKFLSAILTLLSMALLFAASPALTLYEGNIDDVELYAPDGSSLSVLSDIDESGFIIRSRGDGQEVFTSPFGKLYLKGDTILAITGFTTADPTLYLISGETNLVLDEDMRLSFYTPTTCTLVEGKGEYAFISTDDEEAFMNYSSATAYSYDSLRATTIEVGAMEELRYADASVAKATQASYYTHTVLSDQLVYDEVPEVIEPAEPETTVPVIVVPVETETEEPEAEPVAMEEEAPAVPSAPSLLEPIVSLSAPVEEEIEEPVAEPLGEPSAPFIIEPIQSLIPDEVPPVSPEVGYDSWIEPAAVPTAPVVTNSAWLGTPSAPIVTNTAWIERTEAPVVAYEIPEEEDVEEPEYIPGEIVPIQLSDTSIAENQAETTPIAAEPVAAAEESDEPFFSYGVEAGARYPLNWNKGDVPSDPVILITPYVNIGRGNWQIGLRAPLQMAFTNGPFRLVGFNGRELWDFGIGDGYTNAERIYYAITDSFALIDHIYLGDADQTVAYLRAERGYVKNGTIFSSFGYEEGLSLRLGFNFPNLAFRAYVANIQAPSIGEVQFSLYPFRLGGASLSINVPFEMVARDRGNYMISLFPELRIDLPFADDAFRLSAFAMGMAYTSYSDGDLEESQIIYDFQKKSMLPFMAGGEIALDISPVTVTLTGGYRNGMLSPEYFNEFTAAMNETIADKTGDVGTAVFAKASLGLDFGVFGIGLSYSVNDLLEFSTDPQDVARISFLVDAADMVKVYGAFAKRNLVNSFDKFDAKDFFMGSDTLFALGVDLDFGHFGFNAEARTVHLPTGGMKNGSFNIYELTEESYLLLKLTGRVEF